MGDLLKRLGLSAPKSATATAPGGSAGSRGGGGGGAGGGGGGGGGSPPKGPSGAPPGWPPQGPPGPQNTAAQQVHDDILNFDREVKGFRDEAEAVASKMERVTNRWRDIEAQAMRGKVGTHVYATELEKFEKEMAPLRSRQAAMAREAQVLAARAEALAVRLTNVGAAEMTIAFRTANPRDVLQVARRGIPRLPAGPGGLPGAATVEFMAFAAVTLALAYFIAQDVRYILSSDSVLQGLGRTAEVGGKYAVGAAEMALFKAVTRSTPVTAVLAMVVGMCGDQAGACEAQERREREEAQQKQMREDERQMHRAIGAFLNEQAPGSVEWLEDHWEVKNRKLWDQTVKRVQQMRVDNYVRQQMGAKIKAHELGVQDGRLSDEFIRVEDMHDWDVVKDAPVPDQRFLELFDEYKLGFKEGNAKRAALMTKYRQLGYKDGKAGRPAHRDDVASDVEVIQLLKSGVPGPMIYPQLYANYDEGFNASKAAAH